jgi:hypothetical protein
VADIVAVVRKFAEDLIGHLEVVLDQQDAAAMTRRGASILIRFDCFHANDSPCD